MFKNLSLGQKIHVPILFMMVMSIVIITINVTNTLNDITNEAYEKYSSNMKILLQNNLNEKKQIGLTNAINLSFNKEIINALKNNEKKDSYHALDLATESFYKYTDFKRVKIHIHTADTKSFIRNWNKEKSGDDLSSFRKSLVDMKNEQKPFVTVESGRAGMLLRGIAPVFDGETYVGSLEFIQGFNSVARKIKDKRDFSTLFLSCLNESGINMFDKQARHLNGMLISQKDAIDEDLLKALQDFDPKYLVENKFMIKDDFFITSIPIKNHKNKKIGCGIIASKLSYVTQFAQDTKESMINQIKLIVVIDLLLLLALMLILQRSVKKPMDTLVESIEQIESSLEKESLKDLYINHRLKVSSNDEISKVSASVNKLLKKAARVFTDFQRSEKKAKEYIKAVDAGSIVSKSDTRGFITYVNDSLCENTGYSKDELIGKPHSIFRHQDTPKTTFRKMWNTIKSGEIYHGLFKNKRKDGSAFYASITIVPIKDDKEQIIEYVALRDDVTELVNSKEELKKNFFTDSLTRLSNRFKLLDDIQNSKANYLAVIDIHEFRQINDFYGHEIGDLVIVDFAKRLFEHFEDEAYNLYRVHGDEFAVLVQNSPISSDMFYKELQSFIASNKKYVAKIEDHEITTRVTCGVSYSQDNLIAHTELAHKTAKKQSKEILQYSEQIKIGDEYKKNLQWTNKIKEAIEDNRIQAFFQPIVNTKTNKIEKYETLMRLIEKDGKEISPFFFLDIAKKSRLYKDLTKIVVTQAFKKFKDTSYEFSINLSAEDIMMHHISEWFFELACEYKVNNQIVIELVESEGIESFDMVDTFIQNAKENGMKIAIDDFGTGYSNFEYLIKLNTDYLKIDGSLIKEIDTNEKLYSVVETMAQFAKKNDIKVIAEFIANENLYQKIKELDIEYGQGFYLGKPNKDLV